MPSAERRRENAEAKRKKILDAAITLFQERGFDNVTIDEIVKEAGFSRGTFYKLFLGKEDLVVSYMGQWNLSYADYYERELKERECDALEKNQTPGPIHVKGIHHGRPVPSANCHFQRNA